MTATLDHVVLTGGLPGGAAAPFVVVPADDPAGLRAHRRLRHRAFVDEQGLFAGSDHDDVDDDPRTRVLVARGPGGEVLGGVRLHPADRAVDHPGGPAAAAGRDIGWWRGSRLVVTDAARRGGGVGAALVRAACAAAEAEGALRFDALVQARSAVLFSRLGWRVVGPVEHRGRAHVHVDWPVQRARRLAAATKAPLGGLLAGLLGGPLGTPVGFLGDDAAPVPGSDLVAASDAILPSMVERDPVWAGWCAVLVNVNDLAAMGARPVGLLDAVGARDASFARRVLRGLGEAAQAWGVPVLGGHTQLGVPAALSVTALGRTATPVPGGGGRPGHALRLSADLGGGWRPGYTGAQWDSTSHRTGEQLRHQQDVVPALAPAAAKDVSMAGVLGTAGMLAEASGCRAEVDVAAVPRPAAATAGDWLTCFPGFAVLTAEAAPSPGVAALPGTVTTGVCGRLTAGSGVGLRWPDGTVTEAVGPVTGMGPA
ncbi:MSMEG_0567/sll0787 family protein [Jannaschia sp. R86511]|uniref:MSMEG_0567/sll0787 family protein n=1 Tax=Jannaschia sp. R86511 TaxID=3093853 RepID=UPI0036D31E5C